MSYFQTFISFNFPSITRTINVLYHVNCRGQRVIGMHEALSDPFLAYPVLQ